MDLQVIGSGSAGNCYILRSGGDTLLLDAGVRFTRIAQAAGHDLSHVRGCLITHEHMDHAQAAPELAKRGIPCFASAGTADALEAGGQTVYKRLISPDRMQVSLPPFLVRAFATEHDAAEPVGYLVLDTRTGEKLVYATDTYFLRYTFPGVHYWVVECNYVEVVAEQLIRDGVLDPRLYERLSRSHMSLERLLTALAANDLRSARKIVLVHLSDARADEAEMVRQVERAARVACVAAQTGISISLALYPF